MAKNSAHTSGGSKSRLLYGVAIVLFLALAFIATNLFMKFFETEEYYVVSEEIGARTQVTAEDIEPVVVPKDSSPKAAIGMEEVQTGNVYTQYPLLPGDILTTSNVGPLQDISVGVPDSWVVTNFSVKADNAVGGRITRGTYFDIMVTDADGQSFYPFVNVLALDTTVNMNNASSAGAVDTEEAQDGQTTQYVVGMSPADAGKLHSLMAKYDNVRLLLSPRQNEYKRPQLSEYDDAFSYTAGADGVTWPGQSESGEVTDYSFTDVERDTLGRPTETVETCSEGNAKVTGEDCD